MADPFRFTRSATFSTPCYTDSLLGFNAGGTIPGWTNVRYYTPVRDGTGQTFVIPGGIALDGYPVPVGEASTNPIFNLLPGGGLVNQNLVAWYWDNGYEQTDPIAFLGSGYGVAMLDVLATWIATNPAYPGGALVDGTAGGTYASGILDRSQEVITERPLFGYINYPSISTLFAQRQSGIETFVATLLPGLGRNIYAVGRLPQTPPPVAPPGPQWLYQKRRHTAWNPPAEIQPAVNAFGAGLPNTTTGIDTAITIEGTVPVTGQSWYLRDDWVAYFVPWRVNPIFGLAPAVQGQLYWDWSSPLFGQNPLALGLFDATTSPPWNPADGQGTGGLGYPHYPLTGQTPLWANWAQGPWPNPLWPQHNSTVLRSHSNRWPVNLNGFGSLAWVGIGANTMVQYSFGTNSLPSSVGYAFGTAGAPSIIAAHVDQIEAGAGLPPAAAPTPGPGRYRASVLHYQAAQIPGSPPPPALGPYLEATLVNNGSAVDWQFLLPPAEVVSTEILALRPAGL